MMSSFSSSLGETTHRRQNRFCILKLCTRCQIWPVKANPANGYCQARNFPVTLAGQWCSSMSRVYPNTSFNCADFEIYGTITTNSKAHVPPFLLGLFLVKLLLLLLFSTSLSFIFLWGQWLSFCVIITLFLKKAEMSSLLYTEGNQCSYTHPEPK